METIVQQIYILAFPFAIHDTIYSLYLYKEKINIDRLIISQEMSGFFNENIKSSLDLQC